MKYLILISNSSCIHIQLWQNDDKSIKLGTSKEIQMQKYKCQELIPVLHSLLQWILEYSCEEVPHVHFHLVVPQ